MRNLLDHDDWQARADERVHSAFLQDATAFYIATLNRLELERMRRQHRRFIAAWLLVVATVVATVLVIVTM